MAPRSSMMARAVKNIFSATGTFFPANDAMPIENAISVAVGTPQPVLYGVPLVHKRKMIAGKAIPPMAAKTGRRDFFRDDNSPSIISLLISIPARKKKK